MVLGDGMVPGRQIDAGDEKLQVVLEHGHSSKVGNSINDMTE